MKDRYIILFLVVFNFAFISSIKAQINGVVSLGETFRTVPNGYSDLWGTSLTLGVELKNKIQLTIAYKNFIELYTDGLPSNRHYHFLSINSKFHFLSSERFFRPVIKLSAGSELKLNQWGRYDSPLDFSIDKHHFYPNLANSNNSTNIYYSTPLLIDIQTGVSLFSTSHFRVSTLVGYGLRLMSYKYIEYDSTTNSEELKEILNQKPYEMFTNESDLAYHKQRIRYYIARYGYSTKIYEFELLSEPWHINENWTKDQSNQGEKAPFLDENHPEHNLARNAIYTYHKVISEYIKDSLQHWRHLIGIDMAAYLTNDGGSLDKSIGIAAVDIVGFNPYYISPNALLINDTDNNFYKYVQDIWAFRKSKRPERFIPVIISEGGTDETYHECSNYSMDPVDKMSLPFSGIAGYNSWPGYTPMKFSHEDDVVSMAPHIYDMWKTTIRTKNHMNGEDVINTLSDTWGGWKHGMGEAEYKDNLREKYSVEHQYYTSSNKKHAVGYVKNKSFNINTRGNAGTECSSYLFDNVAVESPRNTEWDDVYMPNRLRVRNLKTHTEYKIDWYSYNQYIKTDCIETNKKDGNWGITLEYPELTVSDTGSNDLPVVWYVVYQQPCNSGMAQQNNIEESEESLKRLKILNNNVNMEEELIVYPNPFNNFISIQSPQKDELILKSIEGKIIDNYEIEKGYSRVNTTNLSGGIYILTFVNKNKTFKIVKQ